MSDTGHSSIAPLVRLCALVLALLMCGGHWGIWQVFAWGDMLVERSQHMSFSEAVSSTFSGLDPCEHCCSLANAKADASGAPSDAPKSSRGIDLMLKSDALASDAIVLPQLAAQGNPSSGHHSPSDTIVAWLLDQSIDHPPRA